VEIKRRVLNESNLYMIKRRIVIYVLVKKSYLLKGLRRNVGRNILFITIFRLVMNVKIGLNALHQNIGIF